MKKILEFLRTTVIGGVVFLLPLFLLYLVFSKAMHLASGMVHPVVAKIGLTSIFGVAAGAILILGGMVAGAFIAGLFGRTRAGQAFLQWIEGGIVSTLPQFGTIQGLANSFDSSSGREVQVVLVPADAGWAIGFTFEPAQEGWYAVFLPGSPQWASGSLAFFRPDDVRHTSLTMVQAIAILRNHGIGAGVILGQLTEPRA